MSRGAEQRYRAVQIKSRNVDSNVCIKCLKWDGCVMNNLCIQTKDIPITQGYPRQFTIIQIVRVCTLTISQFRANYLLIRDFYLDTLQHGAYTTDCFAIIVIHISHVIINRQSVWKEYFCVQFVADFKLHVSLKLCSFGTSLQLRGLSIAQGEQAPLIVMKSYAVN